MAKYMRFEYQGTPRYGRLEGDVLHLLAGDLLEGTAETGDTVSLSDATPMIPCCPTKVLAVGFNYSDHAAEFNTPIPTAPNIFMKPLSCLTAAEAPVYYPKILSERVEYEAELVIVMGKTARHVTEDEAGDYILGYTIGNDVSARTLQSPTGQWSLAKGFDTFGPIGP